MFVRRQELPRINPIRHMEQAGECVPEELLVHDADGCGKRCRVMLNVHVPIWLISPKHVQT